MANKIGMIKYDKGKRAKLNGPLPFIDYEKIDVIKLTNSGSSISVGIVYVIIFT